MTLKELGLTTEDYLDYIRGNDMPKDIESLIEEHWDDEDFPWRARADIKELDTCNR